MTEKKIKQSHLIKKFLIPTTFILFSVTCGFMVLTLGASSVASQFYDSLAYLLELDRERKLNFSSLPSNLPNMVLNDIHFLNGYYEDLGLYESFDRYIESVDTDFTYFKYIFKFSFAAFIACALGLFVSLGVKRFALVLKPKKYL